MPEPILRNIQNDDLSARFSGTSTVAGSPATNEEKVIATLTLATWSDLVVVSGIRFSANASYTVGTSGVTATMRIRQTNVSGNVVYSTGAETVVATQIYNQDAIAFDAAPGVGVYVLTLQIGSGAAISTVSALHMSAIII